MTKSLKRLTKCCYNLSEIMSFQYFFKESFFGCVLEKLTYQTKRYHQETEERGEFDTKEFTELIEEVKVGWDRATNLENPLNWSALIKA